MKRLYSLVALMLLTTSADAGQISFSVGGHRIRIDAPRHCRSTSCASVSVSGIYNSRRDRDDDDRDVAPSPPPPAAAPAPAQVSPPPAPPVQAKPVIAAAPTPPPAVAPLPASAPAVGFATASVSTRPVAALPSLPPVPPPPVQPAVTTQPCVAPPPIEAAPSAPLAPAKPPVVKTLHEEESDSPLGDWQTENKGVVRIAQCGKALCGYALNASSDDKGEAVLINMKPKTDTRWTGSVYSKDSGDTYYGTVDLKGPNTLRVEACALGRFYCSGNNWIRISSRPMITSRQVESRPRS
jgi:hypothetical protein